MRIDRHDNIWTTDVDGHTVTEMNPRGEVLLVLGEKGQPGEWIGHTHLLAEPTDVSIAPNGDIFVAEGHGKAEPRVLRFDSKGTFIRSWGERGIGPGQFSMVHSIVVDASNRVYVADRQNRRVQIFDADGKYLGQWKYAGLPCGLYLSPAGRMYLASGFAGQILELDRNGVVTRAMGQPGKGLGEFGEAHFLTIGPDGEILVADTVKPALHKFIKR
jgi:hypothetical protein